MRFTVHGPASWLEGSPCCHRPPGGDVEVDGGLGVDTVAGAVGAGANVIVAGSALYRDPDGLEHAVTELRAAAEAARAR